ncbi:barstar family protein [Sphingobacterium pedocola]|uniref:Ribonuclease inhibitor n=1 Tax=Sphingobacterium pedocola TaxID=2082722 RepID=A0ABR9T3X5_9SPHI|nr:barstar family protein [Sphingobacterium pedocola]MBE8719589.1 ribonuclease inhibitor [Sphingobacterium pedocola]
MKKTLSISIDGTAINDIASFYEVINQTLMVGEDWNLGNSLDAFDDLLYGGYGLLKDYDKLEIIWKNIEHSRKSMGVEATQKYYLDKLNSNLPYNKSLLHQKLKDLDAGKGQTYFDVLLEIIDSHKNVHLLQF